MQWDNPKDGVKIDGNRMLPEDSTCNCIFGGKISIFFDRASAVAYGRAEGKMGVLTLEVEVNGIKVGQNQ